MEDQAENPSRRSLIIFIAVGVLLVGGLFGVSMLLRGTNNTMADNANQTQLAEPSEETQSPQGSDPAPVDGRQPSENDENGQAAAQNRQAEQEQREREQAAERERQQIAERAQQEAAAERERLQAQATAESEEQQRARSSDRTQPPQVASTGAADTTGDDLPATGPAEDFALMAAVLTLVGFGVHRFIKSRSNIVKASKS